MAERLIFHYRSRPTPVHRCDPRIKLLTLLALTILIFQFRAAVLLFIIPYMVIIGYLAKIPLKQYRRELLVFFLFATVIFLARWLGGNTFYEACIAVVRFLTVVYGGLLLTDTTAPEELALALRWLLTPLGKRRSGEAAATFSLTIHFIPLLFDASREISEARKTRLDRTGRHPVRRIISLGTQLMHHMLDKAEDISYALESRCFTPYAQHGELHWIWKDTLIAAVTIGYLVLAGVMS
ncbi:MAG: energy-coupling factor transporter transmembrane component T family protein [Spirochaetota bacterium]